VIAARDELARVETALEQRTAALLAAQVEVRELDRARAEGHAQRQALEGELARISAALAARDRELQAVREGFSRDLAKQRESAERAEERLRASEKRALLEIDRERGAAAKLQKELDETTKRADRRDADHRRAVEALQAQLGDARHQAGVLQGRLDAVQATNATLQEQQAARHAADIQERPVRPKATTRSTVARPARAPGPPRKAPAASVSSGKTAARRKRG
jgi:Small-conductance mechanosensitive channel